MKYLTDSEVADRFAVSRVTIWRWSGSGNFPKPISIGQHCTRWRLDEVEAFEARKVAERDAGAVP